MIAIPVTINGTSIPYAYTLTPRTANGNQKTTQAKVKGGNLLMHKYTYNRYTQVKRHKLDHHIATRNNSPTGYITMDYFKYIHVQYLHRILLFVQRV